MERLTGEQIAEADLTDRRELGQGLDARYVVGQHPRVTMGEGYVSLQPLSDDAVCGVADDG